MSITEIIEKLRREQKTRRPYCAPCDIPISEITNHFENLKDHIDIVRDMYRNRMYTIKMKDGISYTIDDIEQKIHVDKC